MRSLFHRFDWHKSNAHLLVLSRFLQPRGIEEFTGSEFHTARWEDVLEEHLDKTIKRFLDEGMIERGGVRECLDAGYRVLDLKPLLKARGLKVSGLKALLIDRLIEADPEGMKHLTDGMKVYKCTDLGRPIAQAYIDQDAAERNAAEQAVMVALRNRNFEDACRIVATFETQQVFPRGLNVDWKQIEPANWASEVREVFEGTPKILHGVSKEDLDSLRLAAGAMLLWGSNRPREWLPADMNTGLKLSNETAARMVLFYSNHKRQLRWYRSSPPSQGIRVIPVYDSCENCQRLKDMVFTVDGAPELPYEHCTSDWGCRCNFVPASQ